MHDGYYRPPCGFFLWVRVDDGPALTRRLWRDFALRVLPGSYLTQPGADGANAGDAFVRIALVHDPETTEGGLARLAEALGLGEWLSPVPSRRGNSRRSALRGLRNAVPAGSAARGRSIFPSPNGRKWA